MDPAYVEELIESANDLVEDKFEFEISDEHDRAYRSLAHRAKHTYCEIAFRSKTPV